MRFARGGVILALSRRKGNGSAPKSARVPHINAPAHYEKRWKAAALPAFPAAFA
jgi:hypothetical protein